MRFRFTLLAALLGLSAAASAQHAPTRRPAAPARPVARTAAAPAAKLPAQFFGSHTYVAYVIYDPSISKEPTNTRGVGGTLWLGPAGTYEKKLEFPGPYGQFHFDESGRYKIEGNRISFTYADSKGQPVTYGGTFHFDQKSLSLGMVLNEDAKGGREVYGLVAKGTEKVKRKFDAEGNVTLE
ncbi:hypothetical protein LJ737_14565 [Hymenobacter sp. 15J16-1T3B]|uniref:hypothetical protein n=1 Tax=Hymenobacter sp. 15J16-1T3B TaxID=2886941 RepID=UPI001D122607|nr:hypothetical protein [Hymenobacter sp. 15J16-1T3B]MCC3158470.1 hypothetical protein [Hymenobacter sp. 15J16-1T3B]